MKKRGPDHYSLVPFEVSFVLYGRWLLGTRHAWADRRSDDSTEFGTNCAMTQTT
jgi:hypothetical protein